MIAFDLLSKRALDTAKAKGWHDNGPINPGEQYALMHSELSEGLEAARHGDPPDDKIPLFSGQEAELGDTIIRIMHCAADHSLRVGQALIAKMRFNTRAHKHGGKRF